MRDIEKIRALVGDIDAQQLRYVECAVLDTVGVFMPIAGQCGYATTPEHTHPAYSFILAFDDLCRTQVGDTVIASVPSKMSMMPPGVPHQELANDAVPRYIAILVDETFFHRQLKEYGLDELPPPEKLHPISDRLVNAVKEFMIDYHDAFPGYEKLLFSGAIKITHLIIRQMYNIGSSEHPISQSVAVNRAVEFIYAHLSQKISVETLATKAGYSPSHFTRVFRHECGMSPVEYIMKTRLEFAKRMLRADDKTLTEIALDCGFGSSSYLSQCFSRAYHVSPSKFRSLHKHR